LADPYKPPAARVEDKGEEEELAGRPAEVTRACSILWVAIALGVIALHPAIRGEWWADLGDSDGDERNLVPIVIFGAIAVTALMFLACGVLTYLIGRRNNVARWIMLALLALGWLVTLGEFAESMDETPAAALADVLIMAAELWACYLLFLSPGAAWFRRSSIRR